jgi:alpha-ketoglutarate-dependent taurine dioxygenase
MEITVLSDNFGVEITKFDCSQNIQLNDIKTLKDLIQSKHFICFKNQNLDGNSLANFTKNFGDLEAYPEKDKTKGKIEIFNVSNVSEKGSIYHQMIRGLYSRKITHVGILIVLIDIFQHLFQYFMVKKPFQTKLPGGQTEFSNMLMAYEDLPEDKKELLEPLHQVHSYNDIRRLEPGLPELTYEEKSNFPPVTHPVVRVHPDRNYKKSLYFTSNTSLEIGGMSLEEGKKLHSWLVQYISQDQFCYKHYWEKNDLIMWDNRVLLHRVIPYNYAKYRRAMIRGTVEGTVPVLGPFSNQIRMRL